MKKTTLTTSLALILGFVFSAFAGSPVPDTGQTTSYTTTFGEDSDYLINPPSYTKLGQNGVELADSATYADGWIMTRDNVTGLIWEMKTNKNSVINYNDPHDADNTYTWYNPNAETNGGNAGTPGNGTDTQDFITALNDAEFGGYSNWRMPTRKELRSIVHFGTSNPATNTAYFPNTVASYYWSSTTYVSNSSIAWYMYFYYGYGYNSNKSNSYYVRAVRGGQ